MAEASNQQTLAEIQRLRLAGKLDDAENLCREILQTEPDHAGALQLLGLIRWQQGNRTEALAALRQSLKIQPQSPDGWFQLARLLATSGQPADAFDALQKSVELKPDFALALAELAGAYRQRGMLAESAAAYRRLLKLDTDPHVKSNLADFTHLLANVLRADQKYDESAAEYRRAIELKPDLAEAHLNLGGALKELGQVADAITCYDRYLAMRPDSMEIHSHRIYALHLDERCDAKTIFEQTIRWSRRFIPPSPNERARYANDRSPDRVLRIGYLSPDLHAHPVSFFLEPLLASHNAANVETFCYKSLPVEDAVSTRLKQSARHWRNISRLTDDEAFQLIQKDQIDILVDLAGHSHGSRLLLLARKPAAIAVTWLGYPDTTGIPAVDYRFTDAHADPPGLTDELHTEKLVRLPDCFLCSGPMRHAAAVGPAAFEQTGSITFGSFNSLPKVTDSMIAVWSRILQTTPGGKIIVKSHTGLDNPSPRKRIADLFASHGIDAARVELHPPLRDPADHMKMFHRIDIALDSFPYNGTTVTCESLWMGVPVVTLAGKTHVSRVGCSILSCVGLPELIAEDAATYERIAVELARDRPRLLQIHSSLRRRMQDSPLMDGPQFARNVEAEYRKMWHRWLEESANR